MGREIKRVALDFNWPLNKVWEGFLNPHYTATKCTSCDGGGYNPATKIIADTWYDSENFGVTWRYEYYVDPQGNPATRPPWKIIGKSQSWCHDITQDEVDALIRGNRLYDFTHNWKSGEGWTPKDPMPVVTAAQVNEWSQHGFGHDAINCGICVKQRATRLGVYGYCTCCDGEGVIWPSTADKEKYEAWVETPPPEGEGWQVWETVSEGSPVSPVFATAEDSSDLR
jgi:hypothetical protein